MKCNGDGVHLVAMPMKDASLQKAGPVKDIANSLRKGSVKISDLLDINFTSSSN